MSNSKDNAISNAIQWLCSPRGGNNFYGRVMNGVRRVHYPDLKSVCVTIDDSGHFYLAYDLEWFESLVVEEQLFIIQHEACHLILRHLERATRMFKELACGTTLRSPFNHMIVNVAMDAAVNGNLLRKELNALGPKHPFVDPPRDLQLKDTLTFDEYLAHLIEKAEVVKLPSSSYSKDDNGNSNKTDSSTSHTTSNDDSNENSNDTSNASDDSNDTDDKESSALNEQKSDVVKDDNEEQKEEERENKPDDSFFKEVFPKHVCDYTKQLGSKTEAELDRMENEMKKSVKDIVKKAYDQTMRRRGTIPNEIKQIVEELLKEPQVPWEHIFRNVLKSSIATKMTESALIANYALIPVMHQGILPYPGMQHDLSFNLSVHIDTSGSISGQNYLTFLSEIAGIIRSVSGIKLHVIMFDARIQYENFFSVTDVEELQQQLKNNNKSMFNRYGCGGTDFNPSFKRMVGADEDNDKVENCEGNFEEHRMFKPDLMVFLTDGCAPVSESNGGPIPRYKPECLVIWVICGGTSGCVDEDMGQLVVVIND
jgi:predicted metal-dependent peptidase